MLTNHHGPADDTTRPQRDTAPLFSELAGPYERFTRVLDEPGGRLARWLEAYLPGGGRALDAGCGTGRWSVALAERYDEVLAIDAAPAMIEIAERERSGPTIRYQVRDIRSLTPEDDGLFDAVVVFSCLVHVGEPAPLLELLRRVVAPGGVLLIIEPQRPPTWGSEGWQADFAFGQARALYDRTGDVTDATAALAAILSPSWLRISEISVPMTADRFAEEYTAALPGAVVERSGGEFGVFTVAWRAPAAG
ncbi:class I SAM-dependent methyltransferase [Streptomyces sp. NBC_01803]|uniref:class I SAM-dependent methyltransferase n=1 Tax=Streptomyces sp. NBC_01803 TaxID=2975946 RepID=UPI002DDBBF7B|nr:class I SAM-dependent methyltransferase [Streptomyces sp. NBC_01803]WSA42870.1 class I SAM-dependent methyltransferase [Streptomyces sp. NBC_01803]